MSCPHFGLGHCGRQGCTYVFNEGCMWAREHLAYVTPLPEGVSVVFFRVTTSSGSTPNGGLHGR